MGFLSGVGKFITGSGGGVGTGGDTPTQNVDPALKAARDRQITQASNYRTNMANMKEEQGVQSQESARQGLSQKLANIRSGANSRGLLYSGLRQGAEAGAGSDAAGQVAQERAQINTAVEDQANSLDSQALNSAFSVQKAQQELNDSAYQDALKRKSQGMSLMGMVGGAAGSIGGMAAGSK